MDKWYLLKHIGCTMEGLLSYDNKNKKTVYIPVNSIINAKKCTHDTIYSMVYDKEKDIGIQWIIDKNYVKEIDINDEQVKEKIKNGEYILYKNELGWH